MKKSGLLIVALTIAMLAHAQTIKELEEDLLWYSDWENPYEKIKVARKLQKMDPFNYSAAHYICGYYNDNGIDSVSIYFDNLIAQHPQKPEPFLLRARLLELEMGYGDRDNLNKLKARYLMQGLDLHPTKGYPTYLLAKLYYEDFLFPLKKRISWERDPENEGLIAVTIEDKDTVVKKSTFPHAADSALHYFYQLWNLRGDRRDLFYHSIRQLECYLGQTETSPIPKNVEKNFNQCFFPSSYFVVLNKNWQCDFTTNYLDKIMEWKDVADWLEKQLINLKEDCLYDKVVQPDEIVYRFTWLRTFDNPIAIRIEKTENKIMLYWKVGKGAGGYEPSGLKKSGKKKLSLEEWDEFETLIKESNFDALPTIEDYPMPDGVDWNLERKTSETFKAYNSNIPRKGIRNACVFLLKLTNLKIKEEDTY